MSKKTLRRWGILALVAVLLFSHTVGASASTGAPELRVSTYGELAIALQEASNLEVIWVAGVIEIPEGSILGDGTKTVILKSAGGYLQFTGDPSIEATTQAAGIIFDGAGRSLLDPFVSARTGSSFTDCTFRNCGDLGAVNIYGVSVDFNNCTFKDNRGSYGAHLNIGYNATANIAGCSFTGGSSSNRGGAIYLDNAMSTAIVS